MRIAAVLACAAALAGPVFLAGPAQGTSCVQWPDDVALGAVRGRLPGPVGMSGTSRAFTDSYDYALIGKVRSVDARGLLNRYAEVVVDVEAAFFLPSVPGVVTLSMSDLGALMGYPFEPGRSYFIPVRATGEGTGSRRLTNYVMLCDPVREVGAAETATLEAAAGNAGVSVSHPRSVSDPGTDPVDLGTSGASGPWSAIGAGSVILAGVVATVSVMLTRFRRRRTV